MTVGSLFSGIGGFEKGFEDAGFTTAFQVEIDPACRRVLAHHWPDTPRFEDVRECGAHNLPPCDVLTFGSPCQDLSIAGKRAGLSGERSNLFFEAIRICRELRPAFAVWENVPGALSSNAGRDFGAVLAAFRECGARDIAWRVLDSRYFGVAQRRRRVFVVADFRGERAGEVLFERQSLRGDTPASRVAGEDVAGTLGGGAAGRGGSDDTDRMSFVPVAARHREDQDTLIPAYGVQTANGGMHGPPFSENLAWTVQPNERRTAVAAPLTARCGKGGFTDPKNDNILAFDTTQITSVVNRSNPRAGDPCHPLAAGAHAPCIAFDWQSGGDVRLNIREDGSPALQANQTPAIAFTERTRADGRNLETSDLAYALTNPGSGGRTHSRQLLAGMTVRRLTPVECERLQNFPDGWTAMVSDSARYRALGNAVTVSVARWIGRRLMEAAR